MTAPKAAGDNPVIVRVRVSKKVMVAAKLAAISHDKPLCQLVKDVLVDHLVTREYLTRPNSDL